jgi:hypothetical protein
VEFPNEPTQEEAPILYFAAEGEHQITFATRDSPGEKTSSALASQKKHRGSNISNKSQDSSSRRASAVTIHSEDDENPTSLELHHIAKKRKGSEDGNKSSGDLVALGLV